MSRRLDKWCAVAVVLAIAGFLAPLSKGDANWLTFPTLLAGATALLAVTLVFAWRGLSDFKQGLVITTVVILAGVIAFKMVHLPGLKGQVGWGFMLFVFALWAAAWRGVDTLSAFTSLNKLRQQSVNILVPALFGLWIVFLWEIITIGFGVPPVLLPAPSAIATTFAGATDILMADFRQTFLKAVLAGYVMGCGSGFAVAILVDRVPFLQRGLLPLGNLVSALPIVGVAPIMVMWFGFDWPSKAAVVVIMTFFPMLVNSVAGLSAAGALERDLMRSYAAGYWPTLFKLRLPTALPFIFNALKINSTLALIGAIVAEFFGTPIVGMGFRISTEVGRLAVDMVWAEIVMAAIAGSAFYGLFALIERILTFWHPSYRGRA